MPSPSYKPSPTDYADIFVAAIEGGTGYWASVYGYEYQFSDLDRGFKPEDDFAKATLIDLESGDEFEVDSRTEAWHNAVAKAAEFFDQTIFNFIEDHDAGSGDVAMQFAIHGDVIYG